MSHAPNNSSDGNPAHPLRVLIIDRGSVKTGSSLKMAESCTAELARLRTESGDIHVEHLEAREVSCSRDSGSVKQICAGIDAGACDVLIAEDLTRLGRSPIQVLRVVKIAINHGIRVILPADGIDTLADPSMHEIFKQLSVT